MIKLTLKFPARQSVKEAPSPIPPPGIQGEMTSTEDVDVIRYGLREETDMRVCLLNYRKNGTAFLNQFNLSPLRDTSGKLVRLLLYVLR